MTIRLLALMALLIGAATSALGASPSPSGQGVLAIVSDGDQDAQSYSTRQLADPSRPDIMTLWTAPFDPSKGPAGQIEAPNSNYSPSGVAVLSRDARRAYVVHTMRRPKGATRLNELVPSDKLAAFDVSNPAQPRALGTITVGRQPRSLALSGDGRTIAVLSKDAERPLSFAAVTAQGLAAPRSLPVPGVENGFDDFSFVQWSPAADILAVQIARRNEVRFLSVERDDHGTVIGVSPWGNVVTTNKYPLAGHFTPDGRHYVTSDVNWGPDARGARRGVLTLIRLGDGSAGEPKHLVTDLDIAGQSAESFAISRTGASSWRAILRPPIRRSAIRSTTAWHS